MDPHLHVATTASAAGEADGRLNYRSSSVSQAWPFLILMPLRQRKREKRDKRCLQRLIRMPIIDYSVIRVFRGVLAK